MRAWALLPVPSAVATVPPLLLGRPVSELARIYLDQAEIYRALTLGAPTLLLPMWAVLFGSLGWNFLEYGLGDDGPVWGWIVCGVVFELMALPAVLVIVAGDRLVKVPRLPGQATQAPGQSVWYAAYVVLGAVGVVVGWWTFDALS